MSKKSRQTASKTSKQRYTWKTAATWDDHAQADADRNERQERKQLVKVKRRGDRFEVRVGTPIKEASAIKEKVSDE